MGLFGKKKKQQKEEAAAAAAAAVAVAVAGATAVAAGGGGAGTPVTPLRSLMTLCTRNTSIAPLSPRTHAFSPSLTKKNPQNKATHNCSRTQEL